MDSLSFATASSGALRNQPPSPARGAQPDDRYLNEWTALLATRIEMLPLTSKAPPLGRVGGHQHRPPIDARHSTAATNSAHLEYGHSTSNPKLPQTGSVSSMLIALLSDAAHACGDYVSGEYRFEVLKGVSHWILEEQPDTVADLLLDWFAGHPA